METEIDPIKYGVLWERVQTMDKIWNLDAKRNG